MHGEACPGWEDLEAWWAGDVDPERAAEVEEHVLGCGDCSRRVERIAALAAGVGALVRAGGISTVVTDAVLLRLERDGVRVHRYQLAPGQVVPCSVWPEDQVMAAQLALGGPAPLEARFDVTALVGGQPVARLEDVPVDRASGTVTWATPASAERSRPAMRVALRVERVDAGASEGRREYTLAHEPWSGPGSPR